VEITRDGPLAIGLRSREPIALPGSLPLPSTIELTFPSSKSWIETSWTIEDPKTQIERMGVDFVLQLDGQPTLWDCGAHSTIYGTLRGEELMTFESGGPAPQSGSTPEWVIRHGTADKLRAFAAAERGAGHAAEGWMHIMDSKRCTAMAVSEFGRRGPGVVDRFELHAGGHLVFERRFLSEKTGPGAPKEPKKTLRFWLHFVTTPVQVGAVTSPQSMLAPLEPEWFGPATRPPGKGE
jgi:hypothetical protein